MLSERHPSLVEAEFNHIFAFSSILFYSKLFSMNFSLLHTPPQFLVVVSMVAMEMCVVGTSVFMLHMYAYAAIYTFLSSNFFRSTAQLSILYAF